MLERDVFLSPSYMNWEGKISKKRFLQLGSPKSGGITGVLSPAISKGGRPERMCLLIAVS